MEAYNLHKNGSKIIKELIVSPNEMLNYITVSGTWNRTEQNSPVLHDYSYPRGLLCVSESLYNTSTISGSIVLGSYFNDVKSCEIEMKLGYHWNRYYTGTKGEIHLYGWTSSEILNTNNYFSSVKTGEAVGFSFSSGSKQQTLAYFTSHVQGSTTTPQTLNVWLYDLKFKNIKFN